MEQGPNCRPGHAQGRAVPAKEQGLQKPHAQPVRAPLARGPAGQDPLDVIARNPNVLKSLGGEGDMEDSAEYGELSTKD